MGKWQMANPANRNGRGRRGAAAPDLRFAHLRSAISRQRGFSLIEMLVALAITSALLSASLAALDTSFKSYQVTSESASTHVVTRIVMHRMLSMIRVGTEFGPFPTDVLDPDQNPIIMTIAADDPGTPDPAFIEFLSDFDPVSGDRQITRIEVHKPTAGVDSLVLMLIIEEHPGGGGAPVRHEQPLLNDVRAATFALEYDVGPKLRKATIDLLVAPNDIGDDVDIALNAPTIRLVASASPRNLD